MKRRAFTLIELLVVIAIIGLLASIVLIALNSARVKARDATRQGNARELVTALESYVNDNGNFPPANCTTLFAGWCCLGVGTAGTCWTGSIHGSDALDASLVPHYLPKIPTDPLHDTALYGDTFAYRTDTDATGTYATLHWALEKNNPTSQDCLGGTVGNWGPGGGPGYSYYCLLQIR
jgi:prepilin-type N-terminal cleavage/methylation domain-containing protein